MPTPVTIRYAITEALHRDAVVDLDRIDVVCDGADVWLSGTVDGFAAWRRVEAAVRGSPGVGVVHNDISILVPRWDRP